MIPRYTRICVGAFFLGTPLLALAQVAYDYPTAIPPLGSYTAARYGCFTSPTVSVTPPWDFSSLTFEPPQSMTWEWATISAALFPASYPGATHMLKHVTEGYENIMLLTPDELRQVGLASNVPGQMSDSLVMRVFPSTQGTTYTDTYSLVGDPGESTAHFTPHAVGTLLTPFGSQANVVLLEMELTNFFGNTIEHSYKWYAADNLLVPLAEYYLTSGVLFVDVLSSSTAVGELAAPALHTFPVPTTGTVIMNAQERVFRAELVDVSGHTVQMPFTSTGTGCTVDLSAQAAGAYRLRLLTAQGWIGSTVVKQ